MLTVRKVGAALGAEILDADLSVPLQDTEADQIRSAFLANQVVVFRNQSLSPGTLIQFGKLFGKLTEHPVFPHLPGYPPIVEIRNYGKQYSVNEHWHSDVMFADQPPSATLLYALEMPEVGGDTQFSNQYLAYEGLSDGMKKMVAGLQGVNTGAGTATLAGKAQSEAPESVHPIVRTHPETGKKALFACRAFTRILAGFTRSESEPILETLFSEAARYEYTWRHNWRPGDLVMWDNRCVQHYAIHDHGDASRLLHRCTVEGDRPR